MKSFTAFAALLSVIPSAVTAKMFGGLPEPKDVTRPDNDKYGGGNFCHVWTEATYHDYFALQIETKNQSTEDLCGRLEGLLDSRLDCNKPPGDEFGGCTNVETRKDGDDTIYTTWWWFSSYKTCNFDTPTWIGKQEAGIKEDMWIDGKYWCTEKEVQDGTHRPSTLFDGGFKNFLGDMMQV